MKINQQCHQRAIFWFRYNWHFCFLDPYGSGGQKFPPLGGGGGIGYEANPGVPPATMTGSMMGSDMVMYPVRHSTEEILIFTT